ncbi:MAG TPA: DUF308 domain-containing protein [Candidatus Binatus sp.]|nr:DUF308 domain-containing protein [Candidatus Binatus sp.]
MKIEVKSPGWLRFVEIVSGLAMVFLAVLVLSEPNLTILAFVYLVAIGLLLWAVATILVGSFGRLFSPGLRGLSVGSGVIALIVSLIIFIIPQALVDLLIALLALVLLTAGVAEIIIAVLAKHRPLWLRTLVVVIGLLTSALALLVIFDTPLGEFSLALILASIVGILGLRNLVHGITGHRPIHLYGQTGTKI